MNGKKKKLRKAVLPVAGLGTRFLPATRVMPKEMLPVVDRPMIQYAIDEGLEAGIEQFVLVTGRGKVLIEDHFDINYELEDILRNRGKDMLLNHASSGLPGAGNVFFTRQQKPLGLGHAIWCARHFIEDEPFVVLLPDDLILSSPGCLRQMIDSWEDVGGNMAAVMEVPKEQTVLYGILDIAFRKESLAKARGLVEKPSLEDAPSCCAVIGRYILQPSILKILEHLRPGAGGEIQLTDALSSMIGEEDLHGFYFSGERYDCGNRSGFVEANLAFALANPEIRDRILQKAHNLLSHYSESVKP